MRKHERNSLVQALPWEKPVTAPFVNCGKASLQNRNPKRKRTCAQGGKLHRFLSNWAMVPPCSLLLIRSAHLHWKCESHALPPWRTRVTKEAGGNKKTATSYSWRPCQKRKEKKKKKLHHFSGEIAPYFLFRAATAKPAHHHHIRFIIETSDLENILDFTQIHARQHRQAINSRYGNKN